MSISRVLDIARRGLSVYQGALDVTANNVANASNPNYSRQRVVLETEVPQSIAGITWGSGVKITDIQRVHDNLLEKQIINYNQSYSGQNTKAQILSQIEQIFAEPSDTGLSNLLDEFFNSWQELSVSPNSMPLRTQVVNAAQNISSSIKEVYSDLDIVKSDSVNNFKSKVDTINSLLENIKNYNSKIYDSTMLGESPNDLMDQRDKAINDLSNLVNISVNYDSNNVAQISVGGVFAADASFSAEFNYSLSNNKLSLVTKDGQTQAMLSGGDLNGIADIYNNIIPNYTSKIDTIMNTLVSSVNDLHYTGYTITDPPQAGLKFFESYENGTLKINQDIIDDPSKIAISADGTSGNGDIAVKIGELADQKIINGTTLSDSYSSLMNEVGNDKVSTDTLVGSYQQILEQLQNQKLSYSGVSTDEEMTNIIVYQRAYQACSKVISIQDELLDTLINMV